MLDLWHYKVNLKDRAAAIAKDLQKPGGKLVIRADIGAGRHSIVRLLPASMDVAVVELPSFDDLDAPLHGLVQLASHAGALDVVLDATAGDLFQKTNAVAQALANVDRAVVVLLPVPRFGDPHEDEANAATQRSIEQMVEVLVAVPSLRLAVISTPTTRLRAKLSNTFELAAPVIGAQQIHANDAPEELRVAANELQSWMASTDWASTPLEARLQIGLISLGERPERVALRLEALARRMVQQLERWHLAPAVYKLLLARRALPRSVVAAVSGVAPRWLPLLTACIGYGDTEIRVPEVTRQVLLDAFHAPGMATVVEGAHDALARHHEALDGAHGLRGLGQDQAINWLEKVHHLALGSAACAERWRAQEPAGREQLWERARYLSRERHQYQDAAQLYQTCIETFGQDPYSSHYLAYNLERLRGELKPIRSGYAYAATEDPRNPWWQQRWIRFLIAHGTLAEARTAWQHAIRSIDPDGTRLWSSPWLALNFHYWVARRWLALGRLDEAREVISEIPERWLAEEAELHDLVQSLTAQEQALALGEAVYPASTPIEARWRSPRNLRPSRSGRALVSWAPGRVVEASPAAVTVVVAPTPDDAQQLTFDAASWERMAGDPAEDSGGFFELGIYEGGEQVVRLVPDDGDPARLELEEADLLARVTGWPS